MKNMIVYALIQNQQFGAVGDPYGHPTHEVLLFEYLVPERVGHAVGTGSMSRVLIRTQTKLKSMRDFLVFHSRGFWEIPYVREEN
jgi:hypothetical protein